MRREEFSHLDGKFWQRVRWECMHPIALMLTFIAEVVYLDHAGATLPARSQITQSMNLLTADFAANPHSLSTLGRRTHERVDRMRDLILRFANAPASQYSVVFTSGATAALKLVGECFPWSHGSEFCMLQDNHTSVVGIREYAVHGGAGCCSVLNLTPGVPQSAVGNAVPGTNVSSGVVLDVTPERTQGAYYHLDSVETEEAPAEVFSGALASYFGENHFVDDGEAAAEGEASAPAP